MRHFKLCSRARKSLNTVAISFVVVIFSVSRSCKLSYLLWCPSRLLGVCHCVCPILLAFLAVPRKRLPIVPFGAKPIGPGQGLVQSSSLGCATNPTGRAAPERRSPLIWAETLGPLPDPTAPPDASTETRTPLSKPPPPVGETGWPPRSSKWGAGLARCTLSSLRMFRQAGLACGLLS